MRKGFTLPEVLAVIIILSILTVIIIPPVMRDIESSREKAYLQTISNIKQSTQLYIRDNKQYIEGINIIGNTLNITLQDVVESENLATPIIDPRTDLEISLETPITIVVKKGYKYEVSIDNIIYVE